jgi:hypothetical protein
MSGGVATSASLSANSNLLQGTGSVGFSTTASLLAVSSSQQQISSSLLTLTASYTALSASYIALSGSYNTFSGSASTRITANSSSIQQVSSSQQQISASLLNVIANYATTGSNSFRANQSITGSLVVSSTITAQTLVVQTVTSSIVYSSGSNIFGSATSNLQTFTGSIQASGSSTHFLMGGNVGIGITNPTQKVEIQAPANLWTTRFIGANVASQSYGFYVDAGTNATDTNAMFRSNGGSSVYFYIGGDGKVGVGTSSPTVKLHTYLADGTNDNRLLIQQGSNGYASAINLVANNNDGARYNYINSGPNNSIAMWQIGGGGVENTMIMYTSGSERMRITSAGQVGIGGTPNSWDTANVKVLQLKGTALWTFGNGVASFMSSNIYYDGSVRRYIYADYAIEYAQNAGSHIWYSNPAGTAGNSFTPIERMRITSGGNVLIGTTSNNGISLLQLGGSGNTKISLTEGSSQNGMRWESVATANTFYLFNGNYGPGPGWGLYNVTTAGLPFWIQNNGAATFSGALSGTSATFSSSVTAGDFISTSNVTGAALRLLGGGTSVMYQKWANDGGNYFIGISSSTGAGLLSSQNAYSFCLVTESARDMSFGTTNTERMRITSGGKVGIGVTNPSKLFEVNGRMATGATVSGNLIAGNIASNMPSSPAYIPLFNLAEAAAFSLVGFVNAASYTCFNISQIYIKKQYTTSAITAAITGLYKEACDFSIVNITYSGVTYVALRFTSNPEIDVMWTGYLLTYAFNSDGSAQVWTSGVTLNSTYASY